MDKIIKIEELCDILNVLRIQNKTIVHCHGVFDLLHIGHIRYFEQARRMGDVLVVTLTSDRHVDKGPHRPAFPDDLRAEAIASLKVVDYIAINPWPTAEETLRILKPNIYVKGSEFKNLESDLTGKIVKEAKVVKEIGAKLAYTDDIVFSSTNLINRYLSGFPDEVNNYLHLFRRRYKLDDVLQVLDRMSSLNVIIIGDTIIDEYQYCSAIGKSSKDPVLALKYESCDLFAGGVLAVANHVANFSDRVQLVSVLGEQDSHEDFIRSQLNPNVTPYFMIQDDAPTLIKRRFIEGESLHKLFEVYVMDDSGLNKYKDQIVCNWLKKELPKYDLVIAADFGHGTISDNMRKIIIDNSRFLAVNTQANAGNRGFHVASHYPQSDYICIAEHEARLELRDLKSEIRPLTYNLVEKIGCSRIVVTCGRAGCAVCDNKGGFIKVPAFVQNVVDRVGAGDSFFSITSLLAVMKIENELLGFIGNVVGSLAVEILGNNKAIDKISVQKYITSLLK